jgi:hypothetical protein
MSKLFILVNEGVDLLSADSNGFSDPYCKVEVKISGKTNKTVSFKTKTIMKTLNPIWTEVFEVPNFTLEDLPNTKITFELCDWDFGIGSKTHDPLGNVYMEGKTLAAKLKGSSEVDFKEKVGEPGKGWLKFGLRVSSGNNESIRDIKKTQSIRRESIRVQRSVEVTPQEVDRLKSRLNEVEQQKKDELAEMSKKLVRELKAKKELNDLISQTNNQHRVELEVVTKEFQDKINDCKVKLQKKDKEIEDTLEDSQNEIDNKQKHVDDLTEKVKYLEEEVTKARTSTNQDFGNQIAKLKEEEKTHIAEAVGPLKKELEDKTTKITNFVKREKELKDEVSSNDQKIIDIEKEMKTLREANNLLTRQLAVAQKEKEDVEHELKDKNDLLKQLKNKSDRKPPQYKETLEKIKKNDASLTDILYVDCGVNDAIVIEICSTILSSGNTNVMKLDFSDNLEIEGSCVKSVCELLVKTKSVNELLFHDCPIKKESIPALKDAIKSNQTLVQCQLGKNESPKDISDIEEIMERNFQIQTQ